MTPPTTYANCNAMYKGINYKYHYKYISSYIIFWKSNIYYFFKLYIFLTKILMPYWKLTIENLPKNNMAAMFFIV